MNRDERDAQFTEFVSARLPQLRRIAYALTGDRFKAEDLVQTSLTKLYVAWPRIRHEGGEESYCRQIMVRANIDDLRRPWRRELSTDNLPEQQIDGSSAIEERSALFDALQGLPPQQRKTVVLRYWLGLSTRETAAELGISEGAVKSYGSRGLATLEGALAPQRQA